ncbi:MAG: methyltransferase domain-containing protein [Chloroflexota bacterium]
MSQSTSEPLAPMVGSTECAAQADSTSPTTEYTLDNTWQHARQRLRLLEAGLDPVTMRHLAACGVATDWRCLEVGGGNGSIAEWLCQQVGPSGSVVATDLETRFLDELDHPNLQILRHNIVSDELPAGLFDLVHARLVVMHLPQPMEAMRRMAAALKPGGWLVIEEPDFSTFSPHAGALPEAADLFRRHWDNVKRAWTRRGVDVTCGRRLYASLTDLDLEHVGSEGRVVMVRGGSSDADFWRLTWQQLGDETLASGEMSESELQRLINVLADPHFSWTEATMWSAWGQRPSG